MTVMIMNDIFTLGQFARKLSYKAISSAKKTNKKKNLVVTQKRNFSADCEHRRNTFNVSLT